MKKTLLLLILLLVSAFLFSQKIENVHAEQQGKQVVITYDITGVQSGQKCDVKLYYDQNGNDWKQAMNGLTGDIGSVSAGTNKMITWDVLQNLDRLVGRGFMFKVKAISNVSNTNNDTGTFTDTRDGKIYKWVKIGNQIWMAENLNYKTSSGSWCYDDNSSNCQAYGRLYDWETAKMVCFKGWHLPSDEEWTELINFIGKNIAGDILIQSNYLGNNDKGFNALLGGYRMVNQQFHRINSVAFFWSSSEYTRDKCWRWAVNKNDAKADRGVHQKYVGFSVRCIKD
jgi:uncharacterized protein (TIGR02145 family)